jgi:23S rRNA pseudouridine2605 synthase
VGARREASSREREPSPPSRRSSARADATSGTRSTEPSGETRTGAPAGTKRAGAPAGTKRAGAPVGTKRTGKPAGTSSGAAAAPLAAPRAPSKSPTPTVRLQKALAEAGIASRRGAEELILAGKVKVNGVVVRELGTKIDPQRDRIVVAGEIARSEPKVYYLLNKPDGVVCSAEGQTDDRGRPTVLSLLQGVHERIYPVGRLDFHTRGLLLLTNDGELADLLTHPRNKVLKIYHAKFQGRLDHASLDALAKGVVLDDGVKTKPAEISVIKETDTNTWVEVGLRQGLNRQLRRMGEAIGHPVLKLLRVGLGDLDVDDLDEGQYRRLSRTEIETLRAYAQFGKDGAAKDDVAAQAPAKAPAAKAARPTQSAPRGDARSGAAPARTRAAGPPRGAPARRGPSAEPASPARSPYERSPKPAVPAAGARGTPRAQQDPPRGAARGPAGSRAQGPAPAASRETARAGGRRDGGQAQDGGGPGGGARDRPGGGRGKRLRER